VNTLDINEVLRIADSAIEMEHGQNRIHAHRFKRPSSSAPRS
jgi:hypothetical protein